MEATSLSNYEKKIICDLIETSKSIYSVHERLMQAEKNKDENELIKLRRNLNLAVDVENDLYRKLNMGFYKFYSVYQYFQELFPDLSLDRISDYIVSGKSFEDRRDILAAIRIIYSYNFTARGSEAFEECVNQYGMFASIITRHNGSYCSFDISNVYDNEFKLRAALILDDLIASSENENAEMRLRLVKQRLIYFFRYVESCIYDIKLEGIFKEISEEYKEFKSAMDNDQNCTNDIALSTAKEMFELLSIRDASLFSSDVYIRLKYHQSFFRAGLSILPENVVQNMLKKYNNETMLNPTFRGSSYGKKVVSDSFAKQQGDAGIVKNRS